MNIFVYEAISGGDAGRELESALLSEGLAMLRSIVDDLASIHELDAVTTLVSDAAGDALRRDRASARVSARVSVRRRAHGSAAEFRELARAAAGTIVVAPESHGLLERLSRQVLDAGGRLLGTDPDAIPLCGDKLRLASHLRACDVQTPEARVFDGSALRGLAAPFIVKPRHGAGATDTFVLRDARDAGEIEERLSATRDELIATPLIAGKAASASFLVGAERVIALASGEQRLTPGPVLRYLGGRVPLESPSHAERARRLARAAIDAVEGLRGFAGVDLVLADDPRDDAVIEINPRLTTSILGLRRHHAPWSVARAWLELAGLVAPGGQSLEPPAGVAVEFSAGG